MAGCTRIVAGIPNPLPPSPIFLYMDTSGVAFAEMITRWRLEIDGVIASS